MRYYYERVERSACEMYSIYTTKEDKVKTEVFYWSELPVLDIHKIKNEIL